MVTITPFYLYFIPVTVSLLFAFTYVGIKRATARAMKECSPAELYSKRNVFTLIILLLLAYFELSSREKLGTQMCYTYLLKY